MNDKPTSILIVDDHPTMRDGISYLISEEKDLNVCAEAEDTLEAIRLAKELQPDLAVVDLSLKSGHGIDLVKRLREQSSSIKILVNSMYPESVYAERSLQAGAMGYINKQSNRHCLIEAIRALLSGKTYLSPEMTEQVLRRQIGGKITWGKSPIDSLSDRELEVLSLIGQGNTTGAIARRLHLSVHTIDTYREKLKVKLHLTNGAELNRFAAQ